MSDSSPGRGPTAFELELLRTAEAAGHDIADGEKRETVADLLEEHADDLNDVAAALPDGRADALGDDAAMVRGVAEAHREDDDDVRARLFGAGGDSA